MKKILALIMLSVFCFQVTAGGKNVKIVKGIPVSEEAPAPIPKAIFIAPPDKYYSETSYYYEDSHPFLEALAAIGLFVGISAIFDGLFSFHGHGYHSHHYRPHRWHSRRHR